MLKKTAKFSVVFRDKKREVNFKKSHKIGINSFTRERKLGFDKIMTIDVATKKNKYVQKINKAVSFNLIKHKVFDLLYNDEPIDEMLEKMEKLFLTNTIVMRPNRASTPRLDKDAQKSTMATNTIHHLKRKKKNVGS